MKKKYFTVEHANQLLPKLFPKLAQLMKVNKALDLLDSIDIEYDDDFEENINEVYRNKRYHKLSFDFYKEYYELLKMGIIIKDLDNGLIDFYSLFEGREIFLCYNLGEKKIGFWHEIDTGFSGRKPIKLLEKNKEL